MFPFYKTLQFLGCHIDPVCHREYIPLKPLYKTFCAWILQLETAQKIIFNWLPLDWNHCSRQTDFATSSQELQQVLSRDPSLSSITRSNWHLYKTNHKIRKEWAFLLDCKIGAFVAFRGFGIWWGCRLPAVHPTKASDTLPLATIFCHELRFKGVYEQRGVGK